MTGENHAIRSLDFNPDLSWNRPEISGAAATQCLERMSHCRDSS